jgi:autotransporter strand-loop-strand O-heptosyltransferase
MLTEGGSPGRHLWAHRPTPTPSPPSDTSMATGAGVRFVGEWWVPCLVGRDGTRAEHDPGQILEQPDRWREIVAFPKEAGYRVVCIDQKPVYGNGLIWNHIPHGVEDQTGDRPLAERVRWLKHAEFFVGLSSGLAWLAWAAGTPVVMISGFTHPTNEFATPYRVINYHACCISTATCRAALLPRVLTPSQPGS